MSLTKSHELQPDFIESAGRRRARGAPAAEDAAEDVEELYISLFVPGR